MAHLNRTFLMGRLTDDPEPPRTLPNSGSTVVKFRMAVGKSKKNALTGQWENDPNPLYIDCEAFSKPEYPGLTNAIAQYCQKGKEIFVEGRLQLDSWDDKATGTKRSKIKLIVEQVQFLGGKSDSDGGQQRAVDRVMTMGGGNQYHGQDNSPGEGIPF
jgi:single-strand DNA-binding protein